MKNDTNFFYLTRTKFLFLPKDGQAPPLNISYRDKLLR